ncbi:hypothetical protein Hypma_014282 [Hypsizygus marmoreus]|uniref:Ubiquitin-like protease family profile domain-containing protein n=1 Tax=Hypsizygus marmoreus TaxID=39966 RepID=A0A369JF41_HYPMA|nr:hypothetical protein Hypma_014282 [Hypsizygus marmoreus]
MNLVTSLVINANRHGKHLPVVSRKGDSSPPNTHSAVQTNGYDCGLWVLAGIAAVLRGYSCPTPDEELMPLLRDLLRRQVLGRTILSRIFKQAVWMICVRFTL